MSDPITYFYNNENVELSNFYICNFKYGNYWWKSSEHAYQGNKVKTSIARLKIREAKNPFEAKKLGNKYVMKNNWEDIKVNKMYEILKAKFIQCEKAKYKLLATNNSILMERSSTDMFWGYKGKNMMGLLLIKVRDEILFSLNGV